jgi:hypothetical protein
LLRLAEQLKNSAYGQYLFGIAREKLLKFTI